MRTSHRKAEDLEARLAAIERSRIDALRAMPVPSSIITRVTQTR